MKKTDPTKKSTTKKAIKAENASRRGDWNGVNPVTKIVKPKKGKGSFNRHQKHKTKMDY